MPTVFYVVKSTSQEFLAKLILNHLLTSIIYIDSLKI